VTRPLRLVFRCEGSPRLGLGHVMRSIALAQAVRARGAETVFAMSEGPAAGLAARYGFRVVGLRSRAASALSPISAQADWVVLDGYDFGHLYPSLRRQGVRTCAVMDQPPRPPADLVVNPNLSAGPVKAPALCGARFALVRDEFSRARRVPRAGGLRVLLMFGGSDVAGLTARTLAWLSEAQHLPPLQLTAVVGPLAPGRAAIARAARRAGARLLVAPPDLPSIMAASDLAVTAAGSSVLEMLRLAVVPLMVTVADNQRGIAAAVERAGAGLDLGPASTLAGADLAQALVRAARSRRGMAAAGRRLVDGRGALRVARTLERMSRGGAGV
jgi:UDP-2,4-diacetamido-2,4,6-trideoxy-beta-L-altropyranose hydrolase